MEPCVATAIRDDGLDHSFAGQRSFEDGTPIVTQSRPDSHGLRAIAALLFSGLLAIGAVGGTWAAPAAAGLDAPIRAFDWPSDGAPNDPYFGLQADLAPIGVAAAWATTTGAPTVVVAVLDTGIDASNTEFIGRIVPGFNALTGVADGPGDFGTTTDDNGHGTHVSGTIAAAANNAAGIAGIAPNVSIMPIKVLDADGEGDFGGMRDGLNWAVGHGARIITMSLGGTLNSSAIGLLQPTFTAAHSAGAIVIAASGNDGAAVDEYPCNFTYVICVGSTTKDGSAVSTFSTRTGGLALVAPGEQIASTVPGGGYGYGSGTSMATPHVTGAVALLRSIQPELTPDETLASLTQTARPLVTGGRNPDSGYGLLQVGAAVALLVSGATTTPSPTPTPTPTPTPDPNASPTPTPDPNATPTPDPSLNPVPAPVVIVPAVTTALPRNGTRSVPRAVRPRITFSVPMVGVSTSTIRMKDLSRGLWVTIRLSYSASSRTATIIPATRLAANHSYRIAVGGALAASGGTGLSRTYVITFRTGYR